MIEDVLPENRIFAIAALNENASDAEGADRFHPIGGVGIIRACRRNPDGNSNLIVQGIARARLELIESDEPYHEVSVTEIPSEPGGSEEELDELKEQLISLIQAQQRLGASIPAEIFQFLSKIEAAESLLDLSIYILCSSTPLKLELLETADVIQRFHRFMIFVEDEIQQLKLNQKLKGDLDDENIGNN